MKLNKDIEEFFLCVDKVRIEQDYDLLIPLKKIIPDMNWYDLYLKVLYDSYNDSKNPLYATKLNYELITKKIKIKIFNKQVKEKYPELNESNDNDFDMPDLNF